MNVTPLKNFAEESSKYLVKNSKTRNFVTSLGVTGAILPVVLLEGTVTGGRTYQAYKRDGFVEARERVTEESLGAVFWLFGATMFGKLFDVMGKKFFNMPKEHYDPGQDAIRKPFQNIILEHANDPKYAKSKLANFRLGKILASLVAACAFIGYIVPKMNQGITNKFFSGRIEPEKELDPRMAKMYEHFHHKNIDINSVQNFKSSVTYKSGAPKEGKAAVSFKNVEAINRLAQNFEQNAIYKLMGTDVGTVSGRALNARNKDERVEILFRDLSSIYFYCFSTGAILSFLNNHDVFKGKNTNLNPTSAKQIHNNLISKMAEMQTDSMDVNAFKEKFLGKEDFDKELYKKIFPEKPAAEPKEYLFGLIKKKPEREYRAVNIEDYNKIIDETVKDSQKAAKLKQLGLEMSGLQPELRIPEGESFRLQKILTESQVEDILRGGEVREFKFMKEILGDIYKSEPNKFLKTILGDRYKAQTVDRLTDKYTYIPQKQIEESRQQILDYVESIVETAKNEGKSKVDWETMLKTNKRNIRVNGLYWGVAMGVSALFLSTIIPKFQYWITKMRTGHDGFPGIEKYRQQNAEKKTAV